MRGVAVVAAVPGTNATRRPWTSPTAMVSLGSPNGVSTRTSSMSSRKE
ncbi:hypothetical protein [Actinomadura sp. J1-007]|nr:hypothetical protein [Actinomadura sp. J1-007]